MTFEIVFVLLSLLGMVAALIADKMRPGMILFSVVVLFLCAGILTPKEMLEGFSNKGMITVALLFLVSEGIRQSGTLGQVIKKLLPQGKTTVFKAQLRILPSVAFISAFLNNTPVVVIFAPIIKHWAKSVNLPATKFLIPLSYVTILGGICTLIGTSTNLVVHGMILEAGFEGFSMFELGKVGIFIAIAGIIYIFLFSKRLLPDARPDTAVPDEEVEEGEKLHRVEAVLGARFPGINKKLKDFNFQRHYGAEVKEIKTRNGQRFVSNLEEVVLHEGDTLVVMADDTFIPTWGESSVFVLLTNGNEPDTTGKKKRWFALLLLVLMIVGATVGELPVTKEMFPDIKLDMFFFVSITTIIMAWTNLFPARKYTKYISWDILITIACAFAISKAMVNSGVADSVAKFIIGLSDDYGPHVLLAMVFIITNLFTELITNNAAAALAFPLALSISAQLGVSPTPFFVVICMAASASFSTPIGYQTNLIVQGIGNYKFTDFVRIGLPLNIITFLSKVPFPLMHIDSKWKFKEMIQFRDEYAKKYGWNLIVESNMEAFHAGVGPFTHGSKVHTDLMKTQALLHALDKYKFDAAFGGARRDEEKSRAKERIFSFRDKFHQWDPKNQRPELWDIYNARVHKGESIRVFPISNWTELDIWQYIRLENIPIVPLYYAKERPVINLDGNIIMADDDRLPEKYRDQIEMKMVRFRTLGCWPLTGAVESGAATIEEIVEEMMTTTKSERTTRVIDFDQEGSMEQKKREGYF